MEKFELPIIPELPAEPTEEQLLALRELGTQLISEATVGLAALRARSKHE